MGKTAVFI